MGYRVEGFLEKSEKIFFDFGVIKYKKSQQYYSRGVFRRINKKLKKHFIFSNLKRFPSALL